MKILISGSTGLIGSTLCRALEAKGHHVMRLVRSFKDLKKDCIYWDPQIGELKGSEIEGIDVIINLAGEGIASGRWSDKKKRSILRSRVDSTHLLCETVKGLSTPPKLFLNASAIGFYSCRGDELLTEESAPGQGFLSEVCQQWEKSASLCGESSTGVVFLRFGIVLSTKGGALKQMLMPFNYYVGGVVGSGKQYMSWIHIDDLIGIVLHLLTADVRGPVNVVAPTPVTNAEFTKSLGAVLGKPTFFPLPALVVKLVFGEMGKELLLASTRVDAGKIVKSGYTFQFPGLDNALKDLISREH